MAKIVPLQADTSPHSSSRFAIHLQDGRVEHVDMVVYAVGGIDCESALEGTCASSSYALKELSPELLPRSAQLPMLCPLAIDSPIPRRLKDIRIKCAVSLLRDGTTIARESGEILFREFGISGIAAFNLSRHSRSGDEVSIDLLPDMENEEVHEMLEARKLTLTTTLGTAPSNLQILEGIALPSVAEEFLRASGTDPTSAFVSSDQVARLLKEFRMPVQGVADADRAQVHRGGVEPSAVRAHSLEAVSFPGLYVVGEALDVDGPCGGYNLHFAWTSGLLAASSLADSL